MPRQKQKRRDLKLKSTCDAAGGVLIHAEVCNFPVVIFSPRDSHSVSVDSELLSRTRRTSFLNRARVQNLRQPCDPPPLRLRVQTQQHDRLHTCRAGWWEGKVTPHGNPKIKDINTDVRLHQSVSAGGCRGRQLSGMSKCQVFILHLKKKKSLILSHNWVISWLSAQCVSKSGGAFCCSRSSRRVHCGTPPTSL